jgi:hypothetical protein
MAHSQMAGLAAICCVPMVVIAAVLVAAGGTSAGFLVPAIVAGAMIGVFMFTGATERSHRHQG